jgi:putative addiction module killer protein
LTSPSPQTAKTSARSTRNDIEPHFGPGYRVYFTRRGDVVYLLLLGENKSSQKRDIKRAIEMARAIEKEES